MFDIDPGNRAGSIPDQLEQWLTRYGSPSANATELLLDQHNPAATAFIELHLDGDSLMAEHLAYGDLGDRSKRLASALAARGVGRGDAVGVLMGKRSELVVTLLAIFRLGAVHLPLFTAFSTPAIDIRLRAGKARVVVTEPTQALKLTGIDGLTTIVAGEQFDSLVAENEPMTESVTVGGDGALILLFTSGTTGSPKGVVVPVRALASIVSYMRWGLDVADTDVFWNAADPGWAYGLYYGIVGPLAIGVPNYLLREQFSASLTTRVLVELNVTNFTAAPTVYRALCKERTDVDGVSLRCASSAGEPLTADVTQWAEQVLGTEVRDQYGQTELGMVVNNHWADGLRRPLTPGSMGQSMPGFTMGVVDGRIAVNVPESPSMWFSGYLDAPEQTAARFVDDGRWYLTGDTGSIDDAGNFYFSARDDDVIIMAGYRIGPFEVESVLTTHPSVAEVAVVGRRDELRGEVLEAFVVLNDTSVDTEALKAELQQLVKNQFAAHAYPRDVHFVAALPKTPSGKIQRFVLRQQMDVQQSGHRAPTEGR
ncbi:AMP-binding protein [Mycolicibacterium palauense]|uniref:AMP-binding protein n=1 Tax=Mycolicibacterium palauense TaxID=2034511 RepID=UPI000BFEB770|nr:AMP-binding protein [Mycolicibacterium palauense]